MVEPLEIYLYNQQNSLSLHYVTIERFQYTLYMHWLSKTLDSFPGLFEGGGPENEVRHKLSVDSLYIHLTSAFLASS